MKLLVLGTGEAFDDKGLGNTSYLFYGKNVPTILFDCGYQVPERLWQYPQLYKKIQVVYLTHLHGDHTMGLAPLFVRFMEEGRTEKLVIFGPKGVKENVMGLAKFAYSSIVKRRKFNIEFKELKPKQKFSFRGLRFSCAHSSHSRQNLSIRVVLSNKRSFAISGDGDLTEETKKLFLGTDLLLHEVFSPKPAGVFHCDFKKIDQYAKESKIKKIGVVHISRHHLSVMKKLIAKKQKQGGLFFMPKPGDVIRF